MAGESGRDPGNHQPSFPVIFAIDHLDHLDVYSCQVYIQELCASAHQPRTEAAHETDSTTLRFQGRNFFSVEEFQIHLLLLSLSAQWITVASQEHQDGQTHRTSQRRCFHNSSCAVKPGACAQLRRVQGSGRTTVKLGVFPLLSHHSLGGRLR